MQCKRKRTKQSQLSYFAQSAHDNEHNYQSCPICEIRVSQDMMNLHLDLCLKKQMELNTSKPNISSKFRDINIEKSPDVSGVWIIHNFISEEEECELLRLIDDDKESIWKPSKFNGNCDTKVYGAKFEYDKRSVSVGDVEIPQYLLELTGRLNDIANHNPHMPMSLRSFIPNECNINSYEKSKEHYLKPHYDDRTLSGPLLMNLSLLCDAIMTYHPKSPMMENSPIYLPRRALQLVTGDARWSYRHSISATDILGPRRVSDRKSVV